MDIENEKPRGLDEEERATPDAGWTRKRRERRVAACPLITHDKFDLQIIGGLGGGEGVRLLIKADPSLGRSGDDTIRLGPILLDTGVGAGYRLNWDWSVVTLARVLTGLPDFGLLFEGNLGSRYDFH